MADHLYPEEVVSTRLSVLVYQLSVQIQIIVFNCWQRKYMVRLC